MLAPVAGQDPGLVLADKHVVPYPGRGVVVPQLQALVDGGGAPGQDLEHRRRILGHQGSGHASTAIDQGVGIASVLPGLHLQVRALDAAGLAAQLVAKPGAKGIADGVVPGRPAAGGMDLAIDQLVADRPTGLPVELVFPGPGFALRRF